MPNILPLFCKQPTRRTTLLAWTIGVVCALSVSSVSYYVTLRTVERDAQHRLQNLATHTKHSISARTKSYNDLLGDVTALFQMADNLDQGQFHRYVSALDMERRFPAISALNYMEYVPQAQRAQFEARIRNDRSLNPAGNPEFAIHPAGVRPDYHVMTYVESRKLNDFSALFGLDGAAYPVYRKALEWSRDTGLLHASGKLFLVSARGQPSVARGQPSVARGQPSVARGQPSVASGQPVEVSGNTSYTSLSMALPHYRKDMPLKSVEQRRAAYRGSVGVSFDVSKLMRSALDEMALPDVHFMLFDVRSSGNLSSPPRPHSDRLIFDSRQVAYALPKFAAPPQADADHFVTVLPIDFNGRNWQAYFSVPKATLLSSFDMLLPWIAAATGLFGAMLVYSLSLFYSLSSSRRRAITLANAMTTELRESHRKLRELAAHTEQIKENERKRIAREIHDELGQSLLALRIDVVMLAMRTEQHDSKTNTWAHTALTQIDATIKSVRQVINDLRPNVLDLGLVATVEWQIAQFRKRTGIHCKLRASDHDIALDEKSATALFRILQESLNNVSKHAKASQLMIELNEDKDTVLMSITDNGIGMPVASRQKTGAFGLIGMEERIKLLGGQFHIESRPGKGVTILVTIPLSVAQEA